MIHVVCYGRWKRSFVFSRKSLHPKIRAFLFTAPDMEPSNLFSPNHTIDVCSLYYVPTVSCCYNRNRSLLPILREEASPISRPSPTTDSPWNTRRSCSNTTLHLILRILTLACICLTIIQQKEYEEKHKNMVLCEHR